MTQRARSSQPVVIECIVAIASVAALVRAVSIAVFDGYAASGLLGIAAQSFSRHVLVGFGVACAALLALAWWRKHGGDALFVTSIAFVAGYGFFLWPTPFVPNDAAMPRVYDPIETRHLLAALESFVIAVIFGFRSKRASSGPRFVVRSAFVIASIAALTLVVARVRTPSSKQRPNVILIALDDLRADRLGCQGYARATTPAIDHFARSAVRFERAFSPTPSTLAAHMTLLTGLQPSAHRVGALAGLPARATTLAQEMKRQGFTTVAQTDDHPWLNPRFGFARGFDVYRRVGGGAAQKNEALEPLLDDLSFERFFLYLDYTDAAADDARLAYEASSADREVLSRGPMGDYTGCDAADNCGARWIAARSVPGHEPDAATIQYLSGLYDAGIRGLDREIGRLFQALEDRGLLETSIVIVTSDHGEAFFEHGLGLHRDLHAECTAIPLLVRPAGGVRERSVAALVGLVDVAPTILDLCDAAPSSVMQGESLAPFVHGKAVSRERNYAALDFGASVETQAQVGVRKASGFLLDVGGVRALFDTSLDPREQHSFAPNERVAAWTALAQFLERESARSREIAAQIGEPLALPPFDAEVRTRLVRIGEPFPGDAAFVP